MGNKRHSKSVIVTILVTVIVLAVLSVIGIRYLMPYYAAQQNSDTDMQYTIYRFAVRLFPLLVGIVLIVIASMIAGNKDDDVDEDDLLPPNSYDDQLFENPSDDPKPNLQASQKTKAQKAEAPAEQVVESDTITDDEFFNIFFDDTKAEQQSVVSSEPADEISSVIEEEGPFEDDNSEPFEDEAVSDVQSLSAETEDSTPENEIKEQPASETVAASPSTDNKLVEAIYALVNKLDEMTDLITYEDEEEDVEEEEEADVVEPVQTDLPSTTDYSVLERKIDKLCESMAKLVDVVSANVIPVPASAPQPQPEAVVTEKVDAPVEAPVEVPVEDKQINDFDANDPLHLMQIEFDSAQEDLYDITFVFTPSSAEQVNLSISDVGDAFEVNGNTIIVIPFLSKDEAIAELDKDDIKYSETIFVAAGEKADFQSLIASRLA